MKTDFFLLLEASIRKRDSLLCVGLDPLVRGKTPRESADAIVAMNERVIGETAGFAACFKPNIAFYEMHGPAGLDALGRTLDRIPKEIPVILDCKRGDIGDTAQAYAEMAFGHFRTHAVTASPYMGKDSVEPFLAHPGKCVFVLAKTTNPGALAIQGIDVASDEGHVPLFMRIAREAASWSERVGLVVAGNDIGALSQIRKALPDIWFLAPGIGAQGGTVEEALEAGMRADGSGVLINVSRAIANAESPALAAEQFRDRIRAAREKRTTTAESGRSEHKGAAGTQSHAGNGCLSADDVSVIKGIIEAGCFKTGDFVLKSGAHSPFYIDLRRIISNAGLLGRVARCYAKKTEGLGYSRIAGIPFAGIPLATAVALLLGKPMIFPRLEKKAHGTGNTIEGAFEKGETVVLLDDLITTGKSKFEALDVLEAGGLSVRDLVVLVERGRSGRAELAERKVTLHACFQVEDFIDVSYRTGIIDDGELARIRSFLETG